MSEGGESSAAPVESMSGVMDTPTAGSENVSSAIETTQESIPTSNDNVRSSETSLDQPASWEWSDGITGDGDVPDWFHKGTFKNIAAQAEGYSKLQGEFNKRLGGFTGAPESEYSVNLSESLNDKGINFNKEDPMFKQFSETAKELNMNQESFDKMVNIYAESVNNHNTQLTEGMVEGYNEMISQEEAALGHEDAESFDYAIERAAQMPGVSQAGLDGILNGICTADDARAFTALVNSSNYSPAPETAHTGPAVSHESLVKRLGDLKGKPGPERERLLADYNKLFPGEKRFGA